MYLRPQCWLGDLGLVIGSAIHTGEIEFRDDDIGGIGVHIAARALALAGARCSRRFRASMERGGGGHPVPGGDRAGPPPGVSVESVFGGRAGALVSWGAIARIVAIAICHTG
jgi:hypothetical protein